MSDLGDVSDASSGSPGLEAPPPRIREETLAKLREIRRVIKANKPPVTPPPSPKQKRGKLEKRGERKEGRVLTRK